MPSGHDTTYQPATRVGVTRWDVPGLAEGYDASGHPGAHGPRESPVWAASATDGGSMRGKTACYGHIGIDIQQNI